MAKISLVFGALLIALGLIGYFGDAGTTGENADATESVQEVSKPSPTALIPAAVGALLVLFGLVALNERFRMHAMHGAALVGVLGFLAGTGRGTMSLVKLMGENGDQVNQRALIFVWIMALLCGAFVFMCVQSFRNARRQREAGDDSASDAALTE